MSESKQSSLAEKLAGNLITESALTVIAAISGGPLAPLLPVLSNSLAASRQQRRVEETLHEIQKTLEAQAEKIRTLTDEQYKILNESVLAILQTTQEEKLNFLRNVATNSLQAVDMHSQEAVILSRIVRDISEEEIRFLLHAFRYDGVLLSSALEQSELHKNTLLVNPSSTDALSVTGLQSLGVLAPPETGWDGGAMRFTSVVGKLIALLREPSHV